VRLRFVACLSGKAEIALTKMRIRDIRIELFLDTRLEIGFAMIITVRAEVLVFKILFGQTNGLHVGFGPSNHRRYMAIILAVAERFRMQDDLMVRIDEGLAVIPLNDPMRRLHFR